MNAFNDKAAEMLTECAKLLRLQDANPYRVNAYLHAAETLRAHTGDVRDVLRDEGMEGLIRLPAIGRGIAASIDEIARTGRLAQLDRLRGEAEPERLFQTLPGVGPALAAKIHDELGVDSLTGLEIAAHDGRLEAVSGVGPRRAEAIRAGLAAHLGRARTRQAPSARRPSVGLLLAVDREYRKRAKAGKLPTIAPRRFNPDGRSWLPILHLNRDGWHFTALYSNTARAHELGRTADWVVIYFHEDDEAEGQATVVTETHGPLQGQRVVRGREAECRRAALGGA
jgi:putative hydrolase